MVIIGRRYSKSTFGANKILWFLLQTTVDFTWFRIALTTFSLPEYEAR